jgi:hypothetical protein
MVAVEEAVTDAVADAGTVTAELVSNWVVPSATRTETCTRTDSVELLGFPTWIVTLLLLAIVVLTT